MPRHPATMPPYLPCTCCPRLYPCFLPTSVVSLDHDLRLYQGTDGMQDDAKAMHERLVMAGQQLEEAEAVQAQLEQVHVCPWGWKSARA